MPDQLLLGEGVVIVPSDVSFEISPAVPMLTAAVDRYRAIIFARGARERLDSTTSPRYAVRIGVSVTDGSEDYPTDWALVDESYELHVPSEGEEEEECVIALYAQTVYGALRALETLAQLIVYDPNLDAYAVPFAPVQVADSPRFHHRGLLVDVARHYQPLARLLKTVDGPSRNIPSAIRSLLLVTHSMCLGMAAAKMNVMHLHLTDKEAFPIQSSAYPKLWTGAFSWRERYTSDDLAFLADYAHARGVAIMAELDTPGQ